MKSPDARSRFRNSVFYVPVAMVCVALLLPTDPRVLAQQAESQVATTTTTQEEAPAPKIPNDQLDSLVAPIALYPDPLLSQMLVASTYPLELIQLEQWMKKNPNLKDKALADAVAKQPWDPSIQGLAAFPDVVTRLSENVAWTSDLGNAFLAQQADVMDAVQRMRAKAKGTGNLKTSQQQKVETQQVEGGKEVIVIQQANPEVVYVPSYDPAVVYGPSAYPYPSYYYPGYVPGMGLAFGAGLALGAAWGGSWGWGCGWGNGDININNNNNFNRNSNRNVSNRSNNWQHNPAHRGNAPYGNRQTANKFGGTSRGPSNRPGGGTGPGNRPGGGAGPGNRPGGGSGPGNRPGGGTSAGNRPGGGTRPSTRPSGGGANSIGNRSVSSRPSAGSRGGGFSGGSSGAARASSSRGGRSMGGGGFSGGGGRGGGGRGGGGGRRR